MDHVCETCLFWHVKAPSLFNGDCKAPNDHRYSRVPMGDGSFAMVDSFGPEETRSTFTCGVWSKKGASQ